MGEAQNITTWGQCTNCTGDGWLPGAVEKTSGPLSFNIKLQDGRIVRCHIDHILLHLKQMAAPDWLSLPGNPTSKLIVIQLNK